MKSKMMVAVVMVLVLPAAVLFADEPLTEAERSDYTRTSLYADIMDFLQQVRRQADVVRIVSLCRTEEGRTVPLVVLSEEGISSPYELARARKSAVLIQANIHAGEVEGKEACLMLIRDIASGKMGDLLKNQVILVIPDLNADGNEKLSEDNRSDNGPPLAGTRENALNLDLNRDYPKLESPEISAVLRVLNTWDPVLFVDMHTKNGSYHRAPVTYTTVLHPNSYLPLRDYMWNRLFPRVEKTTREEFGYESMPYGNFTNRLKPQEGWSNHAVAPRYGTNYVGLRNRFTILNENYPHADFRTRVLASHAFLQAILRFTGEHMQEMRELVERADRETAAGFHKEALMLEYEMEKLKDLTVKSYRLVIEEIPPEDRDKYPPWYEGYVVKKTDQPQDYRIPYFSLARPVRSVELPEGYVILPCGGGVLEVLQKHGILIGKIERAVTASLERYQIEEITVSDRITQGRVLVGITGRYEEEEISIPEGSFYVSLRQPLARVAALLLEPESDDSLLHWGFFNKLIVRQWGKNRPRVYPVYRARGLEDKLDLIGL
ncbi:MAG: M14 family metallopeptidase [Candidatus Krumholzibacteriota bacterium]|nr:M14 family metallopeptidase [Candidatus Krumholzibacteriota bacterium]